MATDATPTLTLPVPTRLPANIPAGSPLLAPTPCPRCAKVFTYAHCDAPGCVMLWCASCGLVHRPDIGSVSIRPRVGAPAAAAEKLGNAGEATSRAMEKLWSTSDDEPPMSV